MTLHISELRSIVSPSPAAAMTLRSVPLPLPSAQLVTGVVTAGFGVAGRGLTPTACSACMSAATPLRSPGPHDGVIVTPKAAVGRAAVAADADGTPVYVSINAAANGAKRKSSAGCTLRKLMSKPRDHPGQAR